MDTGCCSAYGGVRAARRCLIADLTLTTLALVIFQQPRPGPPLPKGESYLTVGWKQIWIALKQYKKLPYTFTYLLSFFLLADVGHTARVRLRGVTDEPI